MRQTGGGIEDDTTATPHYFPIYGPDNTTLPETVNLWRK